MMADPTFPRLWRNPKTGEIWSILEGSAEGLDEYVRALPLPPAPPLAPNVEAAIHAMRIPLRDDAAKVVELLRPVKSPRAGQAIDLIERLNRDMYEAQANFVVERVRAEKAEAEVARLRAAPTVPSDYIAGYARAVDDVRAMRASEGLLAGQSLIVTGLEIALTKLRAGYQQPTPTLAEAAKVLAGALVDWMRANDFRLSQVQGFGYGEDRLLYTVRDCWLTENQIIWQKQSNATDKEADHAEMMRQIEIHRMSLAVAALGLLGSGSTGGPP